jgi:hypothetical protein
VAADRVRSTTISIEIATNLLQRDFGVSRALAAWQIINGPAFHTLSHHDRQLLRRWTVDTRNSALF